MKYIILLIPILLSITSCKSPSPDEPILNDSLSVMLFDSQIPVGNSAHLQIKTNSSSYSSIKVFFGESDTLSFVKVPANWDTTLSHVYSTASRFYITVTYSLNGSSKVKNFNVEVLAPPVPTKFYFNFQIGQKWSYEYNGYYGDMSYPDVYTQNGTHNWEIISQSDSGYTVREIRNDYLTIDSINRNVYPWIRTTTVQQIQDTTLFLIETTDSLITFHFPRHYTTFGFRGTSINRYAPVLYPNSSGNCVFDKNGMIEYSNSWTGNGWSKSESFKLKKAL